MLRHDGRRDKGEGASEQQNHDHGLETACITIYSELARRSHGRVSFSSHNPRPRTNLVRQRHKPSNVASPRLHHLAVIIDP